MGQLQGVQVNPLNGGLLRQAPNTDNVFALIAGIPNLQATDLVQNKANLLLQITDVEALGVNAAYDANNETLVHHHISEVFALAPNAQLYLIPVAEDLSVSDALLAALPAIRENDQIKGLGIVNSSTTLESLNTDLPSLQNVLNTQLKVENRFIDFVMIEGKGGENEIDPTNAVDLRQLNCENVSVVVAQDPNIAAIDPAYEHYAAVGAALGMLAVRKVNENLGSVNIQNKPVAKRGTIDYPLTDSLKGRWLSANLSDGTNAQSLSRIDLVTLDNKGYIFASSYEGYGGIYFSNSPTCTAKVSDYSYIENNRTWNKAARAIRKALMPEVKGVVKKDSQTGFIKSTTISRWQGLANKALEQMIVEDEISGFDIYINPEQYLSEESPLKITGQIVKDDIVHSFEFDLGFTQNIQ